MSQRKLSFASDYMEGCHPRILERLLETNLEQTEGYGLDPYSDSARACIRQACKAPDAEIWFLVGGTQVNATVIDCLLRPWQGVIAPETGHISTHEAGAIEHGGHKVLSLPAEDGKITSAQIHEYITCCREDQNRDHMVMPGLVYLSQPTEYGTLYSLEELEAISKVCHDHDIRLYVDGARLAYALACPANSVTLEDLARYCDAFYIGGTKCGAIFGEALVFPKPGTVPGFFSMMKQHGALLAKGRITGLQFETLFQESLYEEVGKTAIQAADRIRQALTQKGYILCVDSPTNQIFIDLNKNEYEKLSDLVETAFWENQDIDGDQHTIVRLATSWATKDKDVDRLISIL